jgi:hypothetical protein
MADQEMLREIKRVLELTSRVDERVKVIAESHMKMAARFDKFMDQHAELVNRVTKLESETVTTEDMEKKLEVVKTENIKLATRVTSVEANTPYALKIVDQSLEALNKLTDRITKMEQDQAKIDKAQAIHSNKLNTWTDRISWLGEMAFKLIWLLIAAYLLAKLGLSDSQLQFPF